MTSISFIEAGAIATALSILPIPSVPVEDNCLIKKKDCVKTGPIILRDDCLEGSFPEYVRLSKGQERMIQIDDTNLAMSAAWSVYDKLLKENKTPQVINSTTDNSVTFEFRRGDIYNAVEVFSARSTLVYFVTPDETVVKEYSIDSQEFLQSIRSFLDADPE